MEDSTNSAFESFDSLTIDGVTKNYFLQSAKWSKFLGVIGFIGTGLTIVGAISMFVMSSRLSNIPGLPFSPALIGVIYLIMGVVTFFISMYLYNFGAKMVAAIQSNSKELLQTAASNLNNWFKLTGILTIIIVAIYGLLFIVALAV